VKTAIKNTLTTIWVFAFVAMFVCAMCWIILATITYGQKDVANMNMVKLILAYITVISIAIVMLEAFITGPVKNFLEFHRTRIGQIRPATLSGLSIVLRNQDSLDVRHARISVQTPKDIKLSMTDRAVVDLEFDQLGQVRNVLISMFFIEGHLESWNAYYDPDYHMKWVVNEIIPVIDFPAVVKVKDRKTA
jgi:hypothetical protein